MVITLLHSNIQCATEKHKAYKEKKCDPLKKINKNFPWKDLMADVDKDFLKLS